MKAMAQTVFTGCNDIDSKNSVVGSWHICV